MRPLGRWLVPVFLLALGVILLWLGSMLHTDGVANLALQNSQGCNQVNSTMPHTCVTVSSNTEEGVGDLIGLLGACTVVTGVVVGLARWSRGRPIARS